MSDNSKNNRMALNDDSFMQSLPKLDPPYKRSKQEVWDAVQDVIGSDEKAPKRRSLVWQFAAAAVVLVLLSTTAFVRFYTSSYTTGTGELVAVVLPDGSEVQVNEDSELSYHPYWWRAKREVNLEGEAFFEVQKGKTFDVVSSQGTTRVLGTSFNIYARGLDYEVICHTGKVRVTNVATHDYIDIKPQQKALFTGRSKIEREDLVRLEESVSWIERMFDFKATPIDDVFLAIERQYNIAIDYPADLDLRYTGKFSRELSPDQVVRIVCRSFELDYEQRGKNIIIKKI